MALSPNNLELLRTKPHETNLWLSIYQPKTVLACQVNDGSIAKGEREITFNSVTAGSFLSVEADFTMLIGTSAGDDDKGTIRVRSATASVLTVAENSHINWADDDFLTVIDFIDIIAVYPRIIQDPADAEDVIFFKDFDIAYTDQNSVLGTFPCIGPHRAFFLETGSVSVYWSSSGTSNVKGDNLTFDWAFEGGIATGSTARDPGYISYNTAGHYRTRLIVSNDSGGSDTTYRYVSIYDRPEDGTNNPILQWQIQGIDGSRAEGGYTAKIFIDGTLPPNIIPNAIVVIFADDWYGDIKISLGGNSENNSSIVFVGYILRNTIKYNYRTNRTEFDVGTVNRMMRDAEGFSISVESVISPSTWFQLKKMTIPRAMYHYLRWQTTVLKTTDFQYTGDNLAHQYFDADRASVYDAINSFLSEGIIGELVSDRQGKLWAEPSAPTINNSESAIELEMALEKRDWMGEPSINVRRHEEQSFLEYGGIAYSGPNTGTFAALMGNAPGNAPAYRGGVERSQGLILLGQEGLNQLLGNMYAYRNSQYKSIFHRLIGNYRNIDIAPIRRIDVNIDADDTNEGIVLSDSPFHPVSMNWQYDGRNLYFSPNMELAQLVNGFDGDTIVIPGLADEGGFSSPSLRIPNIPSLAIPSFLSTGSYVAVGVGHHFDGVVTDTVLFSFEGMVVTRSNTANAPKLATVAPSNGIYIVNCALTVTGIGAGFTPTITLVMGTPDPAPGSYLSYINTIATIASNSLSRIGFVAEGGEISAITNAHAGTIADMYFEVMKLS